MPSWYKCKKCKFVWVDPKKPKKCPRCDSKEFSEIDHKRD